MRMPSSAGSAPGCGNSRRRPPETHRPERGYSPRPPHHPAEETSCAVSLPSPSSLSSPALVVCALRAEPAAPAVAKIADFTLRTCRPTSRFRSAISRRRRPWSSSSSVRNVRSTTPTCRAWRRWRRPTPTRASQFLGVNSNCNDTPPHIAGHAKKYDLTFPVLRDPANVVADRFGAKRTPEVFVLDRIAERRLPGPHRRPVRRRLQARRADPPRSGRGPRRSAGRQAGVAAVHDGGRLLHRARRQAEGRRQRHLQQGRVAQCCNAIARSATGRARSGRCRC